MRQRKAAATAGTVNSRFPVSSRALTRLVVVSAALWMVWAFGQEAWAAHRLNAQAADLRQANAALAAQNQAYARDIATVQSGAASAEVARQNGYAKPGEHVYVVASPTPGAPSVGAAASTAPAHPAVQVVNASPGAFDGVVRWWNGLWRRH
jgi:cell division protein FtsB